MAKLKASASVKKDILAAGIEAYPNEACGLIIAVGKKQRVVICRNVSTTPRETFAISPVDYAAAASEGEVIAAWHTHPSGDATPTEGDRVGCEACGLPYLIMGVKKDAAQGEIVLLEPCGYVAPYVGRPYVGGVFDCYSIVRDWYIRERGVALSDYPRVETDGRPGYAFFLERYPQEGFVRLPEGCAADVGDVFVIQTNGPTTNHLALYVGDDRILHHCHGRLSSHAIYGGGYWQKHTVAHLRHIGVATTC